MDSTRRGLACALVAVILCGPLSGALAQQPAAQLAPPPGVVVEMVTPEPEPPARGRDIYDIGAGVVTVVKAPLNAALCVLGTSFGTGLFFATLGSSYRASTRVIEEGCAQKWIITGDDLRPRGAPGVFPERGSDARSRW